MSLSLEETMNHIVYGARMRGPNIGSLTRSSAKPFTMSEKQLARFRAGKKVFSAKTPKGAAPHPAWCPCDACSEFVR